MRAEAALRPAEEVVGEADRRHGRDARLERADDPAHERQPQAAVVDAERAEGEQRGRTNCRPRCRKPRRSRPVARCRRSISTSSTVRPGARGVDGHPGLGAANPNASGKHRGARGRRERALARERLARLEAASSADQRARRPLDDPEPAALPLGERRDREVGVGSRQRPRGRRRGRRRRGASGPGGAARSASVRAWPLPRRGRRSDAGARLPRRGRRRVARAVVGDDHLGRRERSPQRRDRRRDRALLVAGGDEDRGGLSHPPRR